MNEKISVVLPVYNVEQYLHKGVESVLNQTYANLEIILIDDGSTDRSPAICDEFSVRDERVIVIHKKNGGLSDARNAGTQIATGKYITYIDSDDIVEPDYVEYLYSLVLKYNCRMSLCTHTVVFENGKRIVYGNGAEEVLTAKQCLDRMLYHDTIDTSAWGKLYQLELAKEIPYPVGKLFEDIGTTYLFFIKSERIACGYQSKYLYMQRKNSIVSGKFNPAKLDLLEMTDKMAKDVYEYFPELKNGLLRRKIYARFSTLNQMLDVKGYDKEREDILKYLSKHKKEILRDKRAQKRDKIAMMLLGLGYPIYKACWKLYINIKKTKNF